MRTGCKPAEPWLALAAHGRGLDSSERVAAYPLDAYPLEVHLNSRLDIRVVRARLVRVRVQVRFRAQFRVRVSQPIANTVPDLDPDPLTMTVTVT